MSRVFGTTDDGDINADEIVCRTLEVRERATFDNEIDISSAVLVGETAVDLTLDGTTTLAPGHAFAGETARFTQPVVAADTLTTDDTLNINGGANITSLTTIASQSILMTAPPNNYVDISTGADGPLIPNEIRGALDVDSDFGYLRLSAGGSALGGPSRSYIDMLAFNVQEPQEQIRLGTRAQERMRITNNGIGIGTTTPTSALDVAGGITATGGDINANRPAGESPVIQLTRGDSTFGADAFNDYRFRNTAGTLFLDTAENTGVFTYTPVQFSFDPLTGTQFNAPVDIASGGLSVATQVNADSAYLNGDINADNAIIRANAIIDGDLSVNGVIRGDVEFTGETFVDTTLGGTTTIPSGSRFFMEDLCGSTLLSDDFAGISSPPTASTNVFFDFSNSNDIRDTGVIRVASGSGTETDVLNVNIRVFRGVSKPFERIISAQYGASQLNLIVKTFSDSGLGTPSNNVLIAKGTLVNEKTFVLLPPPGNGLETKLFRLTFIPQVGGVAFSQPYVIIQDIGFA